MAKRARRKQLYRTGIRISHRIRLDAEGQPVWGMVVRPATRKRKHGHKNVWRHRRRTSQRSS